MVQSHIRLILGFDLLMLLPVAFFHVKHFLQGHYQGTLSEKECSCSESSHFFLHVLCGLFFILFLCCDCKIPVSIIVPSFAGPSKWGVFLPLVTVYNFIYLFVYLVFSLYFGSAEQAVNPTLTRYQLIKLMLPMSLGNKCWFIHPADTKPD